MKSLNVIIGRFQPVHIRHLADLIFRAMENPENEVLILVGSSNRSRTPKNPFFYSERVEMLKLAIQDFKEEMEANGNNSTFATVKFMPLSDTIYSEEQWVNSVRQKVNSYRTALEAYKEQEYNICLYGNEKDESSYYLRSFPEWEFSPGKILDKSVGAAELRSAIYDGGDWRRLLSPRIISWIENFLQSETGAWLLREADFLKKNKEAQKNIQKVSGYQPIYLATDAICFNRERVLMIRRNHHPGKGLISLPGGYIHHEKKLVDSCIIRCREETKLKLEKSWMTREKIYADPSRSLNGRICTIGFSFAVPDRVEKNVIEHIHSINNLEENAFWLPLAELENYREEIFEDHYDIIVDAATNRN